MNKKRIRKINEIDLENTVFLFGNEKFRVCGLRFISRMTPFSALPDDSWSIQLKELTEKEREE